MRQPNSGRQHHWFVSILRSGAFEKTSARITGVLFAVIVITGIFDGSKLLLQQTRAEGQVRIILPAETPRVELRVFVLGDVFSPGAYALPAGALVRDLVESAGGLRTTADSGRIPMTSMLHDAESIYVPAVGEVVPPEVSGKLDLNATTAQQLKAATGISITVARKIIAYRMAHGRYIAVSELLMVPVSLTTYDRIKDIVAVA